MLRALGLLLVLFCFAAARAERAVSTVEPLGGLAETQFLSEPKWVMATVWESRRSTVTRKKPNAKSEKVWSVRKGDLLAAVGTTQGEWLAFYGSGSKRAYGRKKDFAPLGIRLRYDPSDDYAEFIETMAFVNKIKSLAEDYSSMSNVDAGDEIFNHGHRAIAVLARLVPRGEHGRYSFAATEALTLFGEDALAALVRLSRNSRVEARQGAAKAFEMMVRWLSEGERRVSFAGETPEEQKKRWDGYVSSYGFLRKQPATSRILALLTDPDPRPRETAAGATGPLKLAGAKQPLLRMLRENNPWCVMAAIQALLWYEDPSIEPQLEEAVERLVKHWNNEPERPSAYLRSQKLATLMVSEIGKVPLPSTSRLARFMLKSEIAETRAAGIQVLHDLSEKEGVAEVRPLLQDSDPTVRRFAICFLGEYDKSRSYLAELTGLANSEDPVDRYAMANALASIETPGSFDLLKKLVRDPHKEVWSAAIFSLVYRKDTEAEGLLKELAQDSEPAVRREAKEALELRRLSPPGKGE